MGFNDYLAVAVMGVIRHAPFLVVGVIGLWHANPMRERLPRAAGWAASGFLLLIVHSILAVIRDVAVVVIQVSDVFGPTATGLALTFFGLVAYVPLLCGILLLSRAFFLDRAAASATT